MRTYLTIYIFLLATLISPATQPVHPVERSIQELIYVPDGLRMPGDWNGWTNNTGMGGEFDLQRSTTGTVRWQTTFQYTGDTGNQSFKFVSTRLGSDPWGNQWAGNASMQVNEMENLTFASSNLPNNTIFVIQNKWYTTVFRDNGYSNNSVIFMETSASPVAISSVGQSPATAGSSDAVTVTAALAAAPSAEEKFYLRYSTNNWQSSTRVNMSGSGTSRSGVIPAQTSGTTVSYYVFSSTITDPTADFDMLTLRMNNNAGNNYAYTVDQGAECDDLVLSTIPAFPQENTSLTITFNAALGNKALIDYAGDVYVHTGVVTNLSTGPSDWRYVKTNWGENTTATMLSRVVGEDNLYTLTIPDIRDYYSVVATEDILQLAMVFRSDGTTPAAPSYLVHKDASEADFLIDVYGDELQVKVLSPANNTLIGANSVISVCAAAQSHDLLSLYLNNDLVTTTTAGELSALVDLGGLSTGYHWIKAVADSPAKAQARDSVAVFIRSAVVTEALPSGMVSGINYHAGDDTKATLVLHDPPAFKNFAFVIGDFNDWQLNEDHYMKRTPDGAYFWTTVTGLTPGEEYAYQYYIDGELRLADPYVEKVLDPWNDHWIPTTTYPGLKPYPQGKTTGIVSVLQTARPAYTWTSSGFVPPDVRDLVIYELHIRDFTDTDAINAVTEKLDYLQDLGINAIELMPINEFEGNDSWGYNPSFYFATDKAYGTRHDYKRFVDECHKRGIAVILDMVLNHSFSQSPLVQMYFDPTAGDYGKVSADNPWYNVDSPNPAWSWGFDFDHDSPFTRDFIDRVNAYWLTEFRVDGFRFDFTKGFTNTPGVGWDYDAARIAILKRMADQIWAVKPGAYVILEHLTDNSEEVELANYGMLIWGNMEPQYAQATMGYENNSDLSWGLHTARGYTFHNLVSYMESHDEERLMYKNLQYGNSFNASHDIKNLDIALARNELAAAFYLVAPGPKMIWQFGELGYDFSINHCPNGTVDPDCRTSRKPIPWHDTLDYFNVPGRRKLYDVYSQLIHLKTSHPVFRTGNIVHSLNTYLKRIHLNENMDGSGMKVTLLGNFDVVGRNITPYFQQTGSWYEYFTGQIHTIGSTTSDIWLEPGEYRLYSSEPLFPAYFAKSTGMLNELASWGSNPDGSGSIPTDFSDAQAQYYVINNAQPEVAGTWTVSGRFSRLHVGDGMGQVHMQVNSDMKAGTLQLAQNVTLTVNPGNTLVVEEALASDGTIVLEAGAMMTVTGTLSHSSGAQGLMLKSDATGTASLIHATADVPATIERHILGGWTSGASGWHLLSTPVAAQQISTFETSGAGNGYDLYGWNEATATWLNYKGGNFASWNGGTAFAGGRGYLVSYEQPQTRVFDGPLHHASVPVSGLSLTIHDPQPEFGNGWHLLGNPFASALSWNDGDWQLQNVGGVAKIWHAGNQSYTDIYTNGIIPSAQGFFVQVDNAANGLLIPTTARVHHQQAWYKTNQLADKHDRGVYVSNKQGLNKRAAAEIVLAASPSDGSSAQLAVLHIHPNAQSEFDFSQDARFLPGFAPIFYSLKGRERLSTHTLPEIYNDLVIPFAFSVTTPGQYHIGLIENATDVPLWLYDRKLQLEHPMAYDHPYAFISEAGDFPTRFELRFIEAGNATDIAEPSYEEKAWVYAANKMLYLEFGTAAAGQRIEVYDMRGRLLLQHQLDDGMQHSMPLSLQSGIYLVRIVGRHFLQSSRIFID